MRHIKQHTKFKLFAGIIPLFLACGVETEEEGEDELAYGSYALEEQNGGFTTESSIDEFVQEDEEAFQANEEGEAEDVPDEPGFDVYTMKVIWGQFRLNPGLEQATDWSGSIYVSAGIMKVKRIIRFEPQTDMVLEREELKKVEFESVTRPHNDGLLVVFGVPAGEGATVTFETQPITKTFSLENVLLLKEIVAVDELGNKVLFVIHKLDLPSAMGYLGGYWKRLNRVGGIFGGKWTDAKGVLTGKLGGIWGKRRNGKRVFYGIYKGLNNEFKGLLRGTYKPFPENARIVLEGGVFHGVYLDADLTHKGRLRGIYIIDEEGGKGIFHGTWKEKPDNSVRCDENDTQCIPFDARDPVCECDTEDGFCFCDDLEEE